MAGFSEFYATFPDWVEKGLEERASRDFVAEPRNAWVRMSSYYEDPEDGERKILMGGDISQEVSMQFGFTEMYEAGGRIPPKRPIPGITDVSVDTVDKNFKEITVNWRAYSLDQLNRLMPYFLNPSTTVTIEIGWSDIDPEVIIDPFDVEEVRKLYGSMTQSPEKSNESPIRNYKNHPRFKKMEAAQGDYHVYPALIKGFDYSLREQGGFDCTTKLQSITESFFTLATRATYTPRKNDKKESKSLLELIKQELEFVRPQEEQDPGATYAAAYTRGSPDPTNQSAGGDSSDSSGGEGASYVTAYAGGSPDPTNQSAGGDSSDSSGGEGSLKAKGGQTFPTTYKIGANYYYSWGQIEKIINTAFELKKENTKGEDFGFFRYNSLDSKVSYFRDTIPEGFSVSLKSQDLSVCLLNGGDERFSSEGVFSVPKFDSDTNGQGNKLTEKEKGRTGWLYNLFITTEVFKEAIERNEKVSEALLDMLSQANEVCENIWDWKIINEDETNYLSVIDRNHLLDESLDELDFYHFDPFTKTSNVRSMDMSSDLEKDIMSMMAAKNFATSVSETPVMNDEDDKEGQMFKHMFPGKDLILNKITKADKSKERGDEMATSSSSANQVGDRSNYPEQNIIARKGRTNNPPLPAFPKNVSDELDGLSKQRKEQAQKWKDFDFSSKIYADANEILVIRSLMLKDESDMSPRNGQAPMPMKVSITITGMAGLRRRQLFDIEHLPQKVKQTGGVFQIESVSHNVSGNDWSTTIEGTLVVGNLYAENVKEQ